jgi:putative ABC transport system permease protein
MTSMISVVREAIATSRAQGVVTAMVLVIVAAMCAAVLLTTGKTVGAEQSVLSSIDSGGTRSIVVRAQPGSGLDTGVLDRISALDDVAWAGAFGTASDYRNSELPGGKAVAIRTFYGDLSVLSPTTAPPARPDEAFASPRSLEALGMSAPAGSVEAADRTPVGIVGQISVPDYLQFLEPLVVLPSTGDRAETTVLVVVARSPQSVSVVARTVQSLLGVSDPKKIKVATSESLAELRSLVEGQLGSFSRSLMAAILAGSSVLVAAVMYAIVLLRRRDFGRRRALGASQRLIISLQLTQVALTASVGAASGSVIATAALLWQRDPLPGFAFTVAVAVLAVAASCVGAILPALAAARRDPLRELRVP